MKQLFILTLSLLMAHLNTFAGELSGLTATGHDSRIDLRWDPAPPDEHARYNIYTAESEEGPFTKLNRYPRRGFIYSNFIGTNHQTHYYRVEQVNRYNQDKIATSPVVSARSKAMSDDELLTSVQEATFRYFWDYAHPHSGLVFDRIPSRDRNHHRTAVGGTGFGLLGIMIAVERGFITHDQATGRVLKIVRFLQDDADRFHGAWPHWLDGETGKTIRFTRTDNGADLVETSFMIMGLLTLRQYFDADTAAENEIRKRILQLWHDVEWDFFLQTPDAKKLTWHWSPDHGFEINHRITGFNECLITYLLAIASPTHPIPADCYYEGWADNPYYGNPNEYYGIKQWVGPPLGGSLFMTQYPFMCFDPRGKRDRYCNYFDAARNTALINRAYCADNPEGHTGFSELVWGITPSDGPRGYYGSRPGPDRDRGIIAPTGALGSFPFTPKESMASLRHFYHELGDRLWGSCGFYDAFRLKDDWFAHSYLAIDQGAILCMIENHRTGLCWEMFMKNPEIDPALDAIGWERESLSE